MVPPCQLTAKDQDPSLRRTKCSGSKSQPAALGRPPAIPKCTAAALWLLTSQQKQALDRVRRVVNGEGHCQFNAVAAGLGPGHDYAAMRASAILFMVQNPDMLLMTASLQLAVRAFLRELAGPLQLGGFTGGCRRSLLVATEAHLLDSFGSR